MMDATPDMDAEALARFERALAAAGREDEIFDALYRLSEALVPVRLWTVMTVDLEAGLARRAYTNAPEAYPASGTKPITRNDWFEIVHGERRSFVANTLDEIAQVFPDYALIGSLGCGSVLNLPVVLEGTLVATVNLLHGEGHFTPERVRRCEAMLTGPAQAAMAALLKVEQGGESLLFSVLENPLG